MASLHNSIRNSSSVYSRRRRADKEKTDEKTGSFSSDNKVNLILRGKYGFKYN